MKIQIKLGSSNGNSNNASHTHYENAQPAWLIKSNKYSRLLQLRSSGLWHHAGLLIVTDVLDELTASIFTTEVKAQRWML